MVVEGDVDYSLVPEPFVDFIGDEGEVNEHAGEHQDNNDSPRVIIDRTRLWFVPTFVLLQTYL